MKYHISASIAIIGFVLFLVYGQMTCMGIINLSTCSRYPLFLGFIWLAIGTIFTIIYYAYESKEVSK